MSEVAVALWVRRAESDLKIGKDELVSEDPTTDAICFHIQHCTEKYLKAFLVFRRPVGPSMVVWYGGYRF
jgi:HEPN domain-containing protein